MLFSSLYLQENKSYWRKTDRKLDVPLTNPIFGLGLGITFLFIRINANNLYGVIFQVIFFKN